MPPVAPDSPPAPTRRAPSSRSALKGQATRASIVEAALLLSAQKGLEGLSIGVLADLIGMSKSGVFAHFGSREELQISVVREYHARFEQEIFYPAIREPRGLPRLATMFNLWALRVSKEADSGCIYISGAVEFDDRPGPVREALADMVRTWHSGLLRSIQQSKDEGHLRADTDPRQMLFELHGLILVLHHDARFLRIPGALERTRQGFENILSRYRTDSAPTPSALEPQAG